MAIRIIKHEALSDCGSYEVRFPDGQSVYFCWNHGLGSGHGLLTSDEARQLAKQLARAVRRQARLVKHVPTEGA